MKLSKFAKILVICSTLTSSITTYALEKKGDANNLSTIASFQVSSTRQIQQDEIQASLRFEKTDLTSEDVQLQINVAMKVALDLSKKYPDVKTSTGRYVVYKDEQKSVWKGSQTILLDSFSQNAIAQYTGELQKSGFIVDNYSYILSEKARRSLDDNMRLELMQKASQIANNVIAKGLNKKFIRFATIDFSSQNYPLSVSLRSLTISNNNSSNNPVAQAGFSDVQMTANIRAVFGE